MYARGVASSFHNTWVGCLGRYMEVEERWPWKMLHRQPIISVSACPLELLRYSASSSSVRLLFPQVKNAGSAAEMKRLEEHPREVA